MEVRISIFAFLHDSAVACSAFYESAQEREKVCNKPGFAVEPMDSNQPFHFARHGSGEQAAYS